MYAKYSKSVDQQRREEKEQTAGGDDKTEDNNACQDNKTQEISNPDPPAAAVVDEKAQSEEQGGGEKETGSGQEKEDAPAPAAPEVLNLDQLWARLCNPPTECHSLLKNNLTQEIFDELKDKVSQFGGRLEDCIRSGCENTDSGVGVYACDPDAYVTFAPLLDPVIKEYHKVSELKHPECDFGKLDDLKFPNLDPEGKMIVSTRVRVGRSHDSFGFPPVCTLEQRVDMEAKTKAALEKLEGEHKGTYHPLKGMSADTQKQLTEDHFLFNDHDRFLRAAGGYNDWPTGRGIYFNNDKTFLVWINEEDHLRLISMQKGGDLQQVYTRLVKGIQALQGSGLSFARNERLGYLTFCPSNLGTTLRASVHIAIPKLAATPEFKAFCDKHNIQARGIHGEHTESVGGVYDISNKRRLGLSEFQAIEEMYNGVKAVIEEEKKLGGGK